MLLIQYRKWVFFLIFSSLISYLCQMIAPPSYLQTDITWLHFRGMHNSNSVCTKSLCLKYCIIYIFLDLFALCSSQTSNVAHSAEDLAHHLVSEFRKQWFPSEQLQNPDNPNMALQEVSVVKHQHTFMQLAHTGAATKVPTECPLSFLLYTSMVCTVLQRSTVCK